MSVQANQSHVARPFKTIFAGGRGAIPLLDAHHYPITQQQDYSEKEEGRGGPDELNLFVFQDTPTLYFLR